MSEFDDLFTTDFSAVQLIVFVMERRNEHERVFIVDEEIKAWKKLMLKYQSEMRDVSTSNIQFIREQSLTFEQLCHNIARTWAVPCRREATLEMLRELVRLGYVTQARIISNEHSNSRANWPEKIFSWASKRNEGRDMTEVHNKWFVSALEKISG